MFLIISLAVSTVYLVMGFHQVVPVDLELLGTWDLLDTHTPPFSDPTAFFFLKKNAAFWEYNSHSIQSIHLQYLLNNLYYVSNINFKHLILKYFQHHPTKCCLQ